MDAVINETDALGYCGLPKTVPARTRLRRTVPWVISGAGAPRFKVSDLDELRLKVANEIAAKAHHQLALENL